jgi:hypothetical protein
MTGTEAGLSPMCPRPMCRRGRRRVCPRCVPRTGWRARRYLLVELAPASIPARSEVIEDLGVVERHGGYRIPAEDLRRLRVVASDRRSLRHSLEDDAHGVTPRVASRVRIGVELALQHHVQARLLLRLADGGRLERLAPLDEATWDGPAERFELSFDQDDSSLHFDDDVDGEAGLFGDRHGLIAASPAPGFKLPARPPRSATVRTPLHNHEGGRDSCRTATRRRSPRLSRRSPSRRRRRRCLRRVLRGTIHRRARSIRQWEVDAAPPLRLARSAEFRAGVPRWSRSRGARRSRSRAIAAHDDHSIP